MQMKHRRRQEGGTGNYPEMGKTVIENDVIAEGSIFSNNYPKIDKMQFFIEFHLKFSKLSQEFPYNLFFCPNP